MQFINQTNKKHNNKNNKYIIKFTAFLTLEQFNIKHNYIVLYKIIQYIFTSSEMQEEIKLLANKETKPINPNRV